jgi:hypothetical protein
MIFFLFRYQYPITIFHDGLSNEHIENIKYLLDEGIHTHEKEEEEEGGGKRRRRRRSDLLSFVSISFDFPSSFSFFSPQQISEVY